MPVPPPITAIGRCPARCIWASAMMPTRLPVCRLVAVGSKPWYRVTGPLSRARRRRSSSETWATKPRARRVSRTFALVATMGRNCNWQKKQRRAGGTARRQGWECAWGEGTARSRYLDSKLKARGSVQEYAASCYVQPTFLCDRGDGRGERG